MNTPFHSIRYFLFALFTMLLCICSCHRAPSEADRLLDRVDSLCYVDPDSAVVLLEGVRADKMLDESQRARYALLLTMARDKCYISQTNDSLIKIAVRYYDRHGSDLDRAHSYFYLASVHRDANRQPEMLGALLRAQHYADKTSEKRLRALISMNLGLVYLRNDFFEKAEEAYTRAESIGREINDMPIVAFSMYRRGAALTFLKRYVEAEKILKDSYQIADSIGNSVMREEIFASLSRLAFFQGKHASSLHYALKAKEQSENRPMNMTYEWLGLAYSNNEMPDSAVKYLKQAICEDLVISSDCYTALSDIYLKKGDIDSANYYERERSECLEQLNSTKNGVKIVQTESVAAIQTMQNNHKVRIILIVVVVLLVLVVLGGCFTNMKKKHNLRIHNLNNTIQSQKLQLHEQGEQLSCIHDIDDLRKKRSVYVMDNVDSNDVAVKIKQIASDIRNYSETNVSITESDWLVLKLNIDQLRNDYTARLKSEYDLDERYIRICCLLMLAPDLTTETMGMILGVSGKTISRAISHICNIMQIDNGKTGLAVFLKKY